MKVVFDFGPLTFDSVGGRCRNLGSRPTGSAAEGLPKGFLIGGRYAENGAKNMGLVCNSPFSFRKRTRSHDNHDSHDFKYE